MKASPDSPPTTLLSCENLSCGYPGRLVLEGVNLSLKPGTITALLGPNGSGKSTLLRTICKTLAPVGGEIRLGGTPLEKLSQTEVAQRVAFVPQEEHPQFSFTVEEVVLMGRIARSNGIFDTSEDVQIAKEAMQAADCTELRHRPVTELSGGERQRVLLARALAQEASLLLLDEPTSHLDVSHQTDLVKMLRRLAGQGYAVLAAVHDLNLASVMADEALLIHQGRILEDRKTKDLLESSALEETYGVRFQRMYDADGNLRVFPRLT